MKKLFIPILILLIISGCVSSPPSQPTLDRCLGLHTVDLPKCSPPISLPESHQIHPEALASTKASVLLPIRSVEIIVDDFRPQPYQGDDVYFYNRLGGDRGALNNSLVEWGDGQVTVTISPGNTWGGLWMSLNHPIREGLAVDFSAVLPRPILAAYQSQITGITIELIGGTPNKIFRIELKDGDSPSWNKEITLSGGRQSVQADLPPLQNISQLVLVLDRANPGDYVMFSHISFTASTPVTDTAVIAFVWSYGMLLNNWDPFTGLVRDKAADASGEFDAIQATGSLAAATAVAVQLGIVERSDAISIVNKIGDTLLLNLPRNHGLWPHWVSVSSQGEIGILPSTEWSSVDSVIAALALLDAQSYLGLDTSGTELMLRSIEWENLLTEKGISHGYTYDGELIPYAWDVFGGESWLVELAYASTTGEVVPLAYPSAPSANGSGFIDELAWLYILPPSGLDYWGTDWSMYRREAVEKQILYYESNEAASCFRSLDFFGLSAAEVPSPSHVTKENIYQAFGIGGQFAAANDGIVVVGSPAVAPHYSAVTASLKPEESIHMWDWLIQKSFFTPLTNVESLTFRVNSSCDSEILEWNQLKGSWNLALQALGWGRYMAERDGQTPALWQATEANPFLRQGYLILAPNEQKMTPTVGQEDHALPEILEKSDFTCTGESIYARKLPGIYRYKFTDKDGNVYYFSTKPVAGNQHDQDISALPWPPEDSSIPPGISSITETVTENITTRFGKFQALRVNTTREYRVLTSNHSDPSGIVTTSEWYVCGIGLIRGIMNHKGSYPYNLINFERHSKLELFSYTPLP